MKKIEVSTPSMPAKKDWDKITNKIWETKVLTHNGPMVIDFEKKLKKKLHIKYGAVVNNCTTGIHSSLKVLGLKNCEIITTPFSWIASISPMIWENIKPVFVDIDKKTWNIDTNLIENKITKNTKAILAVHTFGNPCNVLKLEEISKKYKIKLLFDAAHATGVKYLDQSLLNYGDISITSFHATKILNSAEGGFCVSKNYKTIQKIKDLSFYGFNKNKKISLVGHNFKMSELHAALGILNLKNLKQILAKKKIIYNEYKKNLKELKNIQFQNINRSSNYSYVPVKLKNQKTLIKIIQHLKNYNINTRRYFYPSLNKINLIQNDNKEKYQNSEELSKRILVLPNPIDISKKEIQKICKIIKLYNH